jgi:peptidylprolyl isomerase
MENTSSKSSFYIGAGIVVLIIIAVAIGLRNKSTDPAVLPIVTTDTTTPLSEPGTPTTDSSVTSTSDTNQTQKIMEQVTLQTNMGDIVIKLDTTNTPNTVKNFVTLASKGFYNETRFHRVIAGFMIQGGDPQSADVAKKDVWGTGGPGYEFADEIKPTNKNERGTISMANAGPNTNGSQFFINVADNTFLNPKHTVFGTVTKGMDVVDKIAASKTDTRDRPLSDVIINKIIVE